MTACEDFGAGFTDQMGPRFTHLPAPGLCPDCIVKRINKQVEVRRERK